MIAILYFGLAGAGSSDFEDVLVDYMKTLQAHKGGQLRSWKGFGADMPLGKVR